MSDDPYVYPGTSVLKNKLGLRDAGELDRAERNLVKLRNREPAPTGQFDLAHLRAIHRHLFQDVYDWAGELRTLEISKGGSQFQFRQYIETGMADVHRRLETSDYLRGLPRSNFAREAGKIIGDVNYVHPFREGNGRTQALYLQQLAGQAGHRLDLTRIDPRGWIEGSIAAHRGDYDRLGKVVEQALDGSQEKDRGGKAPDRDGSPPTTEGTKTKPLRILPVRKIDRDRGRD
jgi:cell filamentation protein